MASPSSDAGRHLHLHPHTEPAPEAAFREAQKWIEAVTGRCFGEKDFRAGLENGILLCELLSSIKPGLVRKINRLPTPIAGLDNLTLFLRGCEELGLKGTQLFDPGDLQDTATRANAKGSDCSKRLKNVLITIYWLGKAANSCASYSGPTLDLKEFEGLLSQMRKEAEDCDSPKRSIRDSGYIDCWDSERSDSLSPPRHGREDSFDSLDSFGSRSRQTPSPDVLVARGSSDGRGSDSESDFPHRRMPDVRKDDMLARRTSVSEPRPPLPFNQFLPNKSNQTAYMPPPLRRKRTERDEGGGRKSWSTATSPIGGDRPFRFSHSASVSDDPESVSMIDVRCDDDVFLNPHSQVRHELMHNQYNQLKEEEDHWQDDLARWKSRRRSVSQDLIKKEEERKMMERLLSGGEGPSQRRKSIKTYKEIVQDKERRERELHDAYRRARTPEEAHTVLQRYAQRFSISESVLERLKLPKLLERSISADPSAPFAAHLPSLADFCDLFEPSDQDDGDGSVGVGGGSGGGSGGGAGGGGGGSNPMQYLRQQSLPAPKFTSTVEAMVTSFTPAAPERPLKAVPLLAPKPYAPQRRTGDPAGDKPVKVDRMLRLNGETEDKMEQKEEARREDSPSPLQFLPCPVSDDAETQEFRVTASSTSPSSSPTHAPKQASPPHASPPHAPKQASPPHTPDTAPPSDSHTRGSPVKSAEEERTSEETLLAEDTPPVTTSQDQAPESQEVDERGPPESQDALEQPESLEQTAPSRPSSLPTELLSEPVAIPLDEDERLPLTETEQSQATGETTCTTAPSLHTTAPTPVPTDPGSEDGHQSTTQISDPVDQLESSHLLAPLSRPPGVLPSAELYNTARAPLASPNPKLRWEFFAPQESPTKELSDVSVPPTVLSMVKRADQWSWDPDEERRRQERWQREQERMLQEKYRREQEKLKQEWERAQREVEEEERKYHEEEQKILEETVAPLTPHSPALPPSPSPLRGDTPPVTSTPQDTVVRSLADWERKQEILERQTRGSTEDWSQRESEPMDRSTEEKSSSHLQKAESADLLTLSGVSEASSRSQQNGQRAVRDQGQPRSPHAPPAQGEQPTLGL
ncbi:LIM and calponin homology domains-containing protein 1 isoform X7 [Clupea harengus]|uniref:LIM and calponin homology domains-containing protein 1 isoform X7 n=1 Tax=Clupea harengus TaxID=7950 RepID=A0A6P8H5V4_CLUHA|nr:LIM and calponin homology domains-containing protein 1 isoform X7 [Clupea harengus]